MKDFNKIKDVALFAKEHDIFQIYFVDCARLEIYDNFYKFRKGNIEIIESDLELLKIRVAKLYLED